MATAGPNYASTVTDDATVGTKAWSNPTNAQGAPDGVYATDSAASGAWTPVDTNIKLYVGGAFVGNNKATGATLPTVLTQVGYGSSSDLWGTTVTQNQANGTDFGFGYSVSRTSGGIQTHYLLGTNFGFTIRGAITGILAEVDTFYDSGGVSFAAGTKILTPQGSEPIENLSLGDKVLGFRYGKTVEGVVTAKRTTIKGTIKLKSSEGEWVQCTLDHRFYIGSGKYKAAQNIRVGETIYKLIDGVLTPVILEQKTNIIIRCPVYTIEVSDCHNYFANDYAVHNIIIGGGGNIYVDSMRITITYTPNHFLSILGCGI